MLLFLQSVCVCVCVCMCVYVCVSVCVCVCVCVALHIYTGKLLFYLRKCWKRTTEENTVFGKIYPLMHNVLKCSDTL